MARYSEHDVGKMYEAGEASLTVRTSVPDHASWQRWLSSRDGQRRVRPYWVGSVPVHARGQEQGATARQAIQKWSCAQPASSWRA